MKKIINLLIGITFIISCGETKVNIDQHQTNTKENPIKSAHSKAENKSKEHLIKGKIDSLYNREDSKCNITREAVTQFNGRQEFWSICNTSDSYTIIKIKSHATEQLYEEIYFLKEEALIYAEESINYTPINHFVQQVWKCHYYIEDDKIISISSLGHGKTEDDNWDPESILGMYKTRMTELLQIKK